MSQGPPFGTNPYSPTVAPGQGPLPPGTVKNWLVESIISLICCGGLLAIPAIVFAAQVNTKLAMGDYQGALQSSASAKMWLMIAVGINVVCGGMALIFWIFAVVMAGMQAQ
jgi:hypothetical protein